MPASPRPLALHGISGEALKAPVHTSARPRGASMVGQSAARREGKEIGGYPWNPRAC